MSTSVYIAVHTIVMNMSLYVTGLIFLNERPPALATQQRLYESPHEIYKIKFLTNKVVSQ